MKRIVFLILIAIIIIVVLLSRFLNNDNRLKIDAASAFYPFASNMANIIYNKSDNVKMVSTNNAFLDLAKGKADIVISTMPSEEQKQIIDKLDLEYIPLFKEPLAIIVNNNISFNDISIDDLKKYYSSNELNTYQLVKNNGSQTCFETIVKNNIIGNNHYEIKIMPDIIDEIGKDEKGIGYAFYSYYTKMHKSLNTKIIDVNGINVKSDDYPLLFDVYLIYSTNNKNDNIQKIVDWIYSDEGQDNINKIK